MEINELMNHIKESYRETIEGYRIALEREMSRKEAMLDYYRDLPDRDLDVYSKLVELAYKRDDK